MEHPPRRWEDLPGPTGWPWIGNARAIAREGLAAFERWADTYGPRFRLRIGPHKMIGIADAETARTLLSERPHAFRRVARLQTIFDELGVNGVFSQEGQAWQRQRRLMMPAFKKSQVQALHGIVAKVAERLLLRCEAAARSGEVVDVHRLMMAFTVDVTTEIAFGYPLNTLEEQADELQRQIKVVFPGLERRINAPFPIWRYYKSRKERELEDALAYVHRTVGEMIEHTRRRLSDIEGSHRPANLLEAMLAAENEDEDHIRFSSEEVFANVITLLLAGEDTTANAMSWGLHYIARNPAIQERICAEAKTVLGGDVMLQSFEQASQLRYTEAFNLEVLRVRSPAPLLYLQATQAMTLGDLSFPEGMTFAVLTRWIGMQEHSFSQPQTFLPERWLGDTPHHVPKDMLAFGAGPRICPGRQLSLLETQLVLSMLVQRFHIEPEGPIEGVTECMAFTMYPKNLYVRIRQRTASS